MVRDFSFYPEDRKTLKHFECRSNMIWHTLLLAGSLRLLCWEWIGREQRWKQGDQVGATTKVQAGADGSLEQGGWGRGDNKWPDSGYILRVEPKGVADGKPLVLPYFWASGYVVNFDLCFKVLLLSHPPTWSWPLSSRMSWLVKVSPICTESVAMPHLVLPAGYHL